LALQPDGQIVVAGYADTGQSPQSRDFAYTRLNHDGTDDPGFGGAHIIDFGGIDMALAAGFDPQGRILLAGQSEMNFPSIVAVARLLSVPDVTPSSVLACGTPGGSAVVLTPTGGTYQPAGEVTFFPGFTGAVRTALADVNGDGVPDMIGGAGPGGGPRLTVIDGSTGAKVADFFAFEESFRGGIFVAAGDVNGDGKADLVVTPDRGGGPIIAVYDGAKLAAGLTGDAAQRSRFFGIEDPAFRGGARPAVSDVNGDGRDDLLISAGFLGGPREALYDGAGLTPLGAPPKLVPDFFAFEASLQDGAYVALGDLNGDGKAELIFGGGPGGGPRVRVLDGAKLLAAGPFQTLDEIPLAQLADFFAGDASSRGGVRPAVGTVNGTKALLTVSGENDPARVRVFSAPTLFGSVPPLPDQVLDIFGGVALADGVFVG
jgi:hypothetical protein